MHFLIWICDKSDQTETCDKLVTTAFYILYFKLAQIKKLNSHSHKTVKLAMEWKCNHTLSSVNQNQSKRLQPCLESLQSPGGWRVAVRPREGPVSLEKFKSSRCIVHLLSWFLLRPQTHQLISWTVFRQKQLWATYWETGCVGAGR